MPDPVAWTMVEVGWKVVTESGDELGRVTEVLGDAEADIFTGLHVTKGLLGGTEYVPSERVARINEGEIHLSA
jgi:uncharacterized protein YrrD